ncbi:hypothetical protein [Bacillus safensis]|uniref:hypothetical protein n=1 Tax=Bacillus safensis TaxID=561879 RepID=UPI0009C1459B|nr:hypothetical protein [Bacillus safensis]ARD57146.1 hypothetical protein BRL64_13515 [Bacillus safensis]
MNKIGWGFPSTNGGQESGLNDSGIGYFQENPISSLTREVIQDSLDARLKEEKPAIVKFISRDLDRTAIPDVDELTKVFEFAAKYYQPAENETYNFFKKGCNLLQKNRISILAIRDYNTSGLTGITKTEKSHFHRLTKTTGNTEKTGMSNGSYGIGKHAPFAASSLRTILYGTLNRDEDVNKGFQGVIKIASFNREEEYPTQGTGFYGYKDGFLPLTDLSHLNAYFNRDDKEYGTDKFILGFESKENWKETVIEEAILSYMWAIINGSLEIQVEETTINKNNLAQCVEDVQKFNPNSKCMEFYLTLTSPNSIVTTLEFENSKGQLETMKLFLLVGEGFKNRVSLTRGTGMKIFEKGNFRTPLKFAGTLIVEGKDLNEVLRKMEPPTHDDWKPGLHKENPKYAKKLKDELYKKLNKAVRDISPANVNESIELRGLESILPSLSQEEKPTQETDLSSVKDEIESVTIVSTSMTDRKKRITKRKKIDKKNTDRPSQKPPLKDPGENPADAQQLKPSEEKARIKKIRAFCANPQLGEYKLIVNHSKPGQTSMVVNLVGESLTEKAHIFQATNDQTGEEITINHNILGPFIIENSGNLTITLKLDSTSRYSLEVDSL